MKSNNILVIGQDIWEIGVRYSKVTGRNLICINDSEDLPNTSQSTIISLTRNITDEIYTYCVHNHKKTSCSLIVATNFSDLSFFVDKLISTYKSAGGIDYKNKRLLNFLKINLKEKTRDKYIASLKRKTSLLGVLTHSDGVDAFLKPSLTLCPFTDEIPDSKVNQPHCIITGNCIRHSVKIETAKKNELLFHPKLINCSLLILGTCHGFVLPHSTTHQDFSLINSLIKNPHIKIIITTVGVALLKQSDVEILMSFLLTEKNIGFAVSKFNSSEDGKRLKFIIIGDSSFKLIKENNRITELINKEIVLPNYRKLYFEVQFLKNYVLLASTNCKESLVSKLKAILLKLNEIDFILMTVDCNKNMLNQKIEIVSREILTFIAERGVNISNDWLSVAKKTNRLGKGNCVICNCYSEILEFEISNINTFKRTLEYCPKCSIIRDVPMNFKINILNSNPPLIGITFKKENVNNVCMRLISGYKNGKKTIVHYYENNVDNEITYNIYDLYNEFIGPIKVSFVFLVNLKLGIVSF